MSHSCFLLGAERPAVLMGSKGAMSPVGLVHPIGTIFPSTTMTEWLPRGIGLGGRPWPPEKTFGLVGAKLVTPCAEEEEEPVCLIAAAAFSRVDELDVGRGSRIAPNAPSPYLEPSAPLICEEVLIVAPKLLDFCMARRLVPGCCCSTLSSVSFYLRLGSRCSR